MTRFNYQSIFYALLILIFAVFHNYNNEDKQENTEIIQKEERAEKISEVAFAQNIILPENENLNKTDTVFEPEEFMIIRNVDIEQKPRILSQVHPETPPTLVDLPVITATAALAKEAESPYTFFVKERKLRWPLASITKLMTAIVATEHIPPETQIPITEHAVFTEGSAGNFIAGEIFSARDIIHAMLIISSNDAAVAIADFYGYDRFVQEMQSTALRIGMHETSFFDPVGFSELNKTTIDDLELLVNYIGRNHKSIFEITALPGIEIFDHVSETTRNIPSNNIFSGRSDFLGGKTGYTDEAQGNLVSLFTHNNKEYLVIVFGSKERFIDTEKLFTWISQIDN